MDDLESEKTYLRTLTKVEVHVSGVLIRRYVTPLRPCPYCVRGSDC